MNESSTTSSFPAESLASGAGCPPGSLVSSYRQEHQNPVNHFLHVGVGWPMVAVSILILPFRPLWSVILFVMAYAIMFFGHFVFERNTPTIFKQPTTPFVMAIAVTRDLWAALGRLAKTGRIR